jgi:hypothetical protein
VSFEGRISFAGRFSRDAASGVSVNDGATVLTPNCGASSAASERAVLRSGRKGVFGEIREVCACL